MASDEEIVQIANNFLISSPPGEFMEVVTDVRALLPNENLINESAPRTFREYNTEQMIVVDSGKGHKVLISKYGEVADGEFLDPQGNQVLLFDHIKQEVTGTRPIQGGEVDSGMEGLRQAYEKATIEYVNEHYPGGAGTVYAKDGQIIVCISSSKFNPNNFWNGRWRAVWTTGSGELTGHFKTQVHYYEDGNVQLNTDAVQKVAVSENDAVGALKAIAKSEQAYQQALEKSYKTMGDTTFKALRRALPITRVKIDWNKIRAYKLGGEMSQKS